MDNPKTTVAGVLMIVAAMLTVVGKAMAGHFDPATDIPVIVSSLGGGVGLITAKDGSK